MLWDNLLQRLYRGLFENSKDAIYISTREGLILDANQSFLELFGYLEEELLTMNEEALFVNSSVREVYIQELEEKGAVKDFELMFSKKEGSEIVCLLSSSIHYASDGTILGYQSIVRDITKRKKMEKLQEVSYKVADAAFGRMDLHKLFLFIHQELSTIIDTNNFYISLYDAEKETIDFPYYVDENYIESKYKPPSRKLSNGLTDYVIKTGQPFYVNGGKKVIELIKKGELEIKGPSPLLWLGVPLINDGKIVGVIAVQSYSSQTLYSRDDLELLEFVSGQIAMTIARQQSEELLKQSEANLHGLIENTSNGIFSLDTDLKLITYNTAFMKQFNIAFKKDPKVGASVKELMPEKDAKYWTSLFNKSLKGKRFTIEHKFKIDGKLSIFEISFNPIITDGDITGLSTFIKNITNRKKAESKLLQVAKQKLKQEIKEQKIRGEAIIEGQDEERQRISLELHDGLGQLLTAIKLNLSNLEKQNGDKQKTKINEIKKLLNETMAETKRVSQNLMPSVLKDFGLVPTIELLCEQNTEKEGTKVIFQTFGVKERLNSKLERGLYRITQEAINNSLKYAKANEINVQLLQKNGTVRLMVEDDGVGFNVDEINKSKEMRGYRHGLHNMRERTDLLNGNIDIDSSLNNGTVISVEISLKKQLA